MKRIIYAAIGTVVIASSALVGVVGAHAETPYPPFSPQPAQTCIVAQPIPFPPFVVPVVDTGCPPSVAYQTPGLGVEYVQGAPFYSGGAHTADGHANPDNR